MDKNDINSLMKIAKKELKEPKKKADSNLEQIRDFIRLCELKESDEHLVPLMMIFDKYESWCKNNKIIPMPKIKFSKLFALSFNRVEKKNIIYFALSPKGFDFTAENQQRIKQQYEKKKTKEKS